jgi:hypothetical protein
MMVSVPSIYLRMTKFQSFLWLRCTMMKEGNFNSLSEKKLLLSGIKFDSGFLIKQTWAYYESFCEIWSNIHTQNFGKFSGLFYFYFLIIECFLTSCSHASRQRYITYYSWAESLKYLKYFIPKAWCISLTFIELKHNKVDWHT